MFPWRPNRPSPLRPGVGALLRLDVRDGVARPYKAPKDVFEPVGAPFASLEDAVERLGGFVLVGPPGSGRRTALEWVLDRYCRLRISAPLCVIVDGRDVSNVADLAAALAWVAVDMTRRFADGRLANRNPLTVWGTEAKRDWYDRLPYRLHQAHAWRVRRNERVEQFGRDPSPITMSTVDKVWDAINRARGATVVILIEHADHWVDQLDRADRDAIAQILGASIRSSRVVLLARDGRAFSDWVPASAVVRMPMLSDTSVATWLVDQFAEGGWTLDPDVATQWALGLDCQPAAVARHAGVVWEYLEAPPGPVRAYDIQCGLLEVMARDAVRYESVWDACTPTQQDVLRLLAREGGRQPTRGRGITPPKASTVQRAVESLIARDIVWREPTRGSRVRFTDPVFRHWLARR